MITVVFALLFISNYAYAHFGTSFLPGEEKNLKLGEKNSIFWNSLFKQRSGTAGVIPAELLYFTAVDDTFNPFAHGGKVYDYFSGVILGGAPFDGFLATLEFGSVLHGVKSSGEDEYYRYDTGGYVGISGEIGIPFADIFTCVIKANFKGWRAELNSDDPDLTIYTDVEHKGFLLRTEALIYSEIITDRRKGFAFNMLLGAGYHLYKAKEEDIGTEYHTLGHKDVDIIVGVNFVINNLFSIEAKAYILGPFAAYLCFSLLG